MNILRRIGYPTALFFLLWFLFAAVTYIWLFPQQINFDLFPRWYGAREMLRGENPYEFVLTDEKLEAEGFPPYISKRFLYLATITWILLPVWLLPFPIAVSLWAGLQLLVLMLLPLLVFYLLRWRIKPLVLVLVIFSSTFINYHAVNVYVIAQFVAYILACLIVAWWQISENRPWLAAIALVGATIRPEGVVLVACILLDLILKRRFRIVLIWAGLMAGIFALTVIQIGFWIPDFLYGVRNFDSWTDDPFHPVKVFGNPVLTALFALCIVGWAGWLLWQMRPLPDRLRLGWSLSVVILACLLILPQTHDWTLLYGLLPVWLLFWAGRGSKANGIFLVLLVAASWPIRQFGPEWLILGQQIFNPLLLGALLTYHWYRWKASTPVLTQTGVAEGVRPASSPDLPATGAAR